MPYQAHLVYSLVSQFGQYDSSVHGISRTNYDKFSNLYWATFMGKFGDAKQAFEQKFGAQTRALAE